MHETLQECKYQLQGVCCAGSQASQGVIQWYFWSLIQWAQTWAHHWGRNV